MNDIEALFKQFIGRPHSEAYAMRLILGDHIPGRQWGLDTSYITEVTTMIPDGGKIHHIHIKWNKDRIITEVTHEGAYRV